jgi:hypothetical protein
MKINVFVWNRRKTNQSRKWFKTKQIEIRRTKIKFENKLKKSNDYGWNQKSNPIRNNQCK